jgi:hypothetical protein
VIAVDFKKEIEFMTPLWFRSKNTFWDVVLKLGTIIAVGFVLYFLINCTGV